jgi:molybdate transport system substrate-binding protein
MPARPAPLRPLQAALAAALLALAACSGDDRPALRVFAAASLTAPFGALVEAFAQERPELRVELHCAGTPQLVLQLREGAPADVFASADATQMQRVVDSGHARGAPRDFASNTLAIVTSTERGAAIQGLQDLGADDVTCLMCGPQVPAGRYARAALARAGVAVCSASDEPSVRAVMSKVGLGVADAGIVYLTDARSAGAGLRTVEIPARSNVRATYPIVTTSSGARRDDAEAFVSFVLGEVGRRILDSHGFGAP